MKPLLPIFFITFFIFNNAFAQTGRNAHGTVTDSASRPVSSVNIMLISDQHDSLTTKTDLKGQFSITGIKGSHITINISAAGYQAAKKDYAFTNDTSADLGTIILSAEHTAANNIAPANTT